jgi:hypothetical protein
MPEPFPSHPPTSKAARFTIRPKRLLPGIILFIIISCLIFVTAVLFRRSRLPSKTIDNACHALAEARGKQAKAFAPKQFAAAEGFLALMLVEWRNQNSRFFLLRNYRKTTEFARAVDSTSKVAMYSAEATKDSLQSQMPDYIQKLGKRIETFKRTLGILPMLPDQRELFTRSELSFAESTVAFKRGDIIGARDIFDSSQMFFDSVATELQQNLSVYFEGFPLWNKWVEQTILWSKLHCRSAIIVDKMAHDLSLYQNGKLSARVTVELGANWIGVKVRRGDRATPEGRYYIRRKIASMSYRKALEINYPNDDDRRLSAANEKIKSTGRCTDLGGDIEIHGGGGKQCNWTDGCIALENDDIDRIYSRVNVGTPVTIVGTASRSIIDTFAQPK